MDFFKKPGHVLSQNLHGLDALLIGCHIADFSSNTQIPVVGARDDHLADGEKVVEGVKGMNRACPANGDHGTYARSPVPQNRPGR